LPNWIFVESRNVWGRFGYLLFSCCRRDSVLSNSDSIFSNSDTGSFTKDHGVRTGDLPPTCAVILSFHAKTAASSLLMASRALCSDCKLRESSISSAVFDSAVNNLYSSSPRFAFPDCKKDNWSYSKQGWHHSKAFISLICIVKFIRHSAKPEPCLNKLFVKSWQLTSSKQMSQIAIFFSLLLQVSKPFMAWFKNQK